MTKEGIKGSELSTVNLATRSPPSLGLKVTTTLEKSPFAITTAGFVVIVNSAA